MTYTAEQLRRDAIAIERMHGETLTVEWRDHQAGLLRAFAAALEENARLRAELAAALDQLHGIKEYRDKNPLGGPAKVFDAMADCVRAGDDFAAVLKEYGFCTAEELAAEREMADRNQEDALTLMRALIKVRQQMFPQHDQRAVVSRDFPKLAAIDSARRK